MTLVKVILPQIVYYGLPDVLGQYGAKCYNLEILRILLFNVTWEDIVRHFMPCSLISVFLYC